MKTKNIDKNVDIYAKLANSLTNLEIKRPRASVSMQQDIGLLKNQIEKYLKCRLQSTNYSKVIKKEFKQIIRQGELHEMNFNWVLLELSGAKTLREQNPGVYDQLLQLMPNYPENYFQPIIIDVTRTTSPSPRQKLYEIKIERILIAYSIRNPFVSYCQGLNFLVHFICNKLKFSEEDTFWLLSSLIENIMPLDYYTNMLSVMVDTKILEYYSKIYVPQLIQHFKEIYLEANFYAIQWFVCLYVPNLHIDIVKEIWLQLLVKGNKALLIAALAILYIFQNELLKYQDFGELLEYFKKALKEYCNVAQFRAVFIQIKIKTKQLNEARELMRKQLQKEQENQPFNEDILMKPKCSTDWTVCQHVLELNKALKRSFSFFVYIQQKPCEVIQDYWVNKLDHNDSALQTTQELLIGRQFHICQEDFDQDVGYRSTVLISFKQAQIEQDEEIKQIEEEEQLSIEDDQEDEVDTETEVRPRSTALYKYRPSFDEAGYDDFYKHAQQLMKKQLEKSQNYLGRSSQAQGKKDLLFPEVQNEKIRQKYNHARQSVSSIIFANDFIKK